MKGHRKHAKLMKPKGGQFHRLEIGFIGAPCSTIQKFCSEIGEGLKSNYTLGYVDAAHHDTAGDKSNFYATYTDKISHHQIDLQNTPSYFLRDSFNNHDAVMVNGNHFATDCQVIFIHESKADSLKRKLDRINNVSLIILDDGETEVFSFLKDHLQRFDSIPIIQISEMAKAQSFISKLIDESVSELTGLILSGGKSQRMGGDKGELLYHGIAQREYAANMIAAHCKQTYISVRNGQVVTTAYDLMEDTISGLGPYGALLSAFQNDPNTAILCLPCDAPLIDERIIRTLVKNRNPHKLATCFHNPKTNFPEPLITIWEPRAYPVLLRFLSMGYSCPRKVLINSDIEEIHLEYPDKLFNANTREEQEIAIKKIAENL